MPRRARRAAAVTGSLGAALAFCLAGCGSASGTPSTAAAGGVTAAPSSTPLFSGGSTGSASAGSPSPGSTPAGPVLSITQLGFRMSFSPALGSVSYAIDSSRAGPVTDSGGKSATYDASVGLASGAYAATACAASYPYEASISVYTTSESQLNFASGPTQWVRAGSHLLGFLPPQNSPCSASQVSHDLPLLQQMFSTAVST